MCGNEKRSLPDTERLRSQVKPYSIKAKARAIKATVNRKNRRMCELSQRSRSLVQDAGASLASPPVPKNFPPAPPSGRTGNQRLCPGWVTKAVQNADEGNSGERQIK